MSGIETEVYRQHSQGREKQAYFLLAAAGASIAFALTQTKDVALAWSQVPLGFGIFSWALSFVAGVRSLQHAQGAMDWNLDLIQVQKGTHRLLDHPSQAPLVEPFVREGASQASRRVGRWGRLQFVGLVGGAAFYIVWHIIEMYLRR